MQWFKCVQRNGEIREWGLHLAQGVRLTRGSPRSSSQLAGSWEVTQRFSSQLTWGLISNRHQRGCGFKTDSNVMLLVILTARHRPVFTKSWQDTHIISSNTTTLGGGVINPIFSRDTNDQLGPQRMCLSNVTKLRRGRTALEASKETPGLTLEITVLDYH